MPFVLADGVVRSSLDSGLVSSRRGVGRDRFRLVASSSEASRPLDHLASSFSIVTRTELCEVRRVTQCSVTDDEMRNKLLLIIILVDATVRYAEITCQVRGHRTALLGPQSSSIIGPSAASRPSILLDWR